MAGGDHFQAEADAPRRAPWHAPMFQVLAFRETATGAVVTSESAQSSGQAAVQPTQPTQPTTTTTPQKQATLCDGVTMPGNSPTVLTIGTTGHAKPGNHTETHVGGCTPALLST